MSVQKAALVLYLTAWSSLIAYISFGLAVARSGEMHDTSVIVPFVAVPVSLGIALRLVRTHNITAWARLRLYAWATPVLLYFAILTTVTVAVALNEPGAAPLVFIFGFLFGLPALFIGMVFHAVGVLPLWFVERKIFADDEQGEQVMSAIKRGP